MSAVTSNSTRPSHRCAASSGSSSSSHCRITPPQIPYRPHAPRSRAPVSSHSARARSSARSMSTSHAARVAASAPARTHEVNGLGLQWPFGNLGLEIWSGAASLHYWSGASGVSGRAACAGAAAWDGREVDALGERGDGARLPPEEDPAAREHKPSRCPHHHPSVQSWRSPGVRCNWGTLPACCTRNECVTCTFVDNSANTALEVVSPARRMSRSPPPSPPPSPPLASLRADARTEGSMTNSPNRYHPVPHPPSH